MDQYNFVSPLCFAEDEVVDHLFSSFLISVTWWGLLCALFYVMVRVVPQSLVLQALELAVKTSLHLNSGSIFCLAYC